MTGTRLYAPSLVLLAWALAVSAFGRKDAFAVIGLVALAFAMCLYTAEILRRRR